MCLIGYKLLALLPIKSRFTEQKIHALQQDGERKHENASQFNVQIILGKSRKWNAKAHISRSLSLFIFFIIIADAHFSDIPFFIVINHRFSVLKSSIFSPKTIKTREKLSDIFFTFISTRLGLANGSNMLVYFSLCCSPYTVDCVYGAVFGRHIHRVRINISVTQLASEYIPIYFHFLY